jgi:hypothetical protein
MVDGCHVNCTALAVQSSDNKPQVTRIYDLLTVLDVAVEGYSR